MSRVILSNAKDLALGLCRRLYEIFHCVQDDKHRGIRIMGKLLYYFLLFCQCV